ncbi:hypothetical protein [Marinobacter mobilis]|uniref:DUF4878 domain-containing protein n=1 Tax=Marinobacter mobilis TaxID=488533 RepID=A0A1H2WMR2_9GAMM|nr:hypothetical protein [Marinobacter mobilis]SDW81912.1 hypothetical protein SAMN04487960_104219 [Marinobacter mobilis]
MKKQFLLPALFATSLLSACSGPDTPQEVSEAFWQSMVEGDAADANSYSTLISDAAFDSFERDWQGVDIQWGRVVIDGNEATVETLLAGLEDARPPLETTTYLVKKNDQWLVDYYRTGDALEQQPLFGNVLGKLEQLGQELQARWSRQSNEMALEIERMTQELEQQAQLANERFSILMEEYGQRLEQQLDELSRSIEEALKENPSAAPEDRRTLNQAVIRLDEQKQQLDEPDLQSVAEGTQVAAQTQLDLNRLGNEFAGYKAEWQQRVAEMESGFKAFLDQLHQPAN